MSLQRGGSEAADAAEEMARECLSCRAGRHEDCTLHQYDHVHTEDVPDIVGDVCFCECEGRIYPGRTTMRLPLPPLPENDFLDRRALYGMVGKLVPIKMNGMVIGEAWIIQIRIEPDDRTLNVTFEFPAQD